jgi:hypothetical protein
MKVEAKVLDWLLEADQPAVRYFALVELLDGNGSDEDVKQARKNILTRGWVFDILNSQKPGGYWQRRNSLYRPKYLATNWQMLVLSDLGVTSRDSEKVRVASDLFFKDWLGSVDAFEREVAEVCVAGNLARMLTRFGYVEDSRVKKLFDWLVDHQKDDGGWHCFQSDKGTLDCWEALAAFASVPRAKRTKSINRSIERGVEFYLERELWREGKRYEPWFRFHYPIHYYYDLLVGLDTITSLGYGGDKRIESALKHMRKKKSSGGTWKLDAVHPDLGPGADYTLRPPLPIKFRLENEGMPSKWITLTALRIEKRVEEKTS